jgi:hypothetical protein
VRNRFNFLIAAKSEDVSTISFALFGCIACGPLVVEDHRADAEVYIQAFCEDACAKHEECAPDPERWEDCVSSECIDRLVEKLHDPCFAEWHEFLRCGVERENCEELYDVHVETRPGSLCGDVYTVYTTCRTEHGYPSDD